jgi:hypothetical protein
MGTRSHIYIETEPGMFLGTYCQFDGYPSHMFPQLEQRTHTEIYGIIIKGQTHGGISGIHPTQGVEYHEAMFGSSFLFSPLDDRESTCVSYVYVKRLDGSVLWRYAHDRRPEKTIQWYDIVPEEEE